MEVLTPPIVKTQTKLQQNVVPTNREGSPNIVFISIDDLNDWIGVLDGYVDVQTPNIDRLASQGILFQNAHTPVPVCNPARTAVMTGLQPDTTGIVDNAQDWRDVIPDGGTLPEYFRTNGYRAVGAGKLFHINKAGVFDQFFGASGPKIAKSQKGRFGSAALNLPLEEYGDYQIASFASDYLAQNHNQPFFLGVGFSRPHIPLTAPQEYFDLYPLEDIDLPNLNETNDLDDVPLVGQELAGRLHESILKSGDWANIVQAYLANISFVDAQVGRVLDAIESNELANNTIIALWSDHGWHLGEKLHWQKRTLWEEATRVPLILSGPGISEGIETNAPVSLVDLFPTLVDLAGLSPKSDLEGHSLTPLIENPNFEWPHAAISVWDNSYAVRTEHWRYIRYWDGTEELYDHQQDPDELTNLANSTDFALIKASLAQELDEYLAEYAPTRLPGSSEGQLIVGTSENDILTGGSGNDTISGAEGDDSLFGLEGENRLEGGDGNDFIVHSSSQKGLLEGNSGSDRLVGGQANDTLDGGLGDDLLEGRGGQDTYIINSSGDRIVNSPDNAGDIVNASVNWTLGTGFSHLKLTDRALIGRGNRENNRIVGNSQDNQLFGDEGNDALLGEEGNDTLVGGLGNDRLLGSEGDDFLDGGAGFDKIIVRKDTNIRFSNNTLVGEGTDQLSSIEFLDITAGTGNNRIDISEFFDSSKLRGLSGNDTLSGGRGDDQIYGGGGYDTVVQSTQQKRIRLTNQSITGNGIDQLKSIENAILLGHQGDSIIDASKFSGNTTIKGRSGDDILIPSHGNTQLTGGAGADTYTLIRRNGGNVKIQDFLSEEGDAIAIQADILGPEFQSGQPISSEQFGIGDTFQTSQQRFLYNPNDRFLYFDIDGLGSANANRLAQLNPGASLSVQQLRLV